jgi:hypothetical protein
MPAGWTIGQITHCSASLACSDSLPVHSSPATAVGEADLTSSATISRQVGKGAIATTATSATLAAQPTVTHPQSVTATVTSSATMTATAIPYVPPGAGADQGIGQLIAAVAGGVGET